MIITKIDKRIFIIVLDSLGIGHAHDASEYHDEGSDTLKACYDSGKLDIPTLTSLGIFNIDKNDYAPRSNQLIGSYARVEEASKGKDTTIGHWEIAGIISEKPLPTYPDGFPEEVISEFEKRINRQVLCNKPYSGTQVINEFGEEHIKTGKPIVYTSADSVFQIAAHEDVIPIEQLYEMCRIAREILKGKHGVGRVIARPFRGDNKDNFKRTTNRHDFSIQAPKKTMLDYLMESGYDTIGVGKIYDIFAGKGISKTTSIISNQDGMEKTIAIAKENFTGLCFVNLVDFDMLYGHRNDVLGYTNALNEVDKQLQEFMSVMEDRDILMITADHGCDPSTPSTDHSRENVPLLLYGKEVKENYNLGFLKSFADIASTVLDIFEIDNTLPGTSFRDKICKE